jgi:hypothetical protein
MLTSDGPREESGGADFDLKNEAKRRKDLKNNKTLLEDIRKENEHIMSLLKSII